MLLGEGKSDDWKLINYRQVGDLVVAEFLHDLYNQAMLDLNPVHFRNTVCVIENGEFRSFAPQKEWDYLAEGLGEKLIRDPDLREKFSKYLERSQKDLTDLMDKLQMKYQDPSSSISGKDAFYDLADLQYMALDRIYAINLVQFEHALGHALTEMLHVPKENVDKFLKSSELTVSGQEEVLAIELSIKVTQNKITFEKAVEIHEKEFGGINLAYGAAKNDSPSHSKERLENLLATPEVERQQRLLALQSTQKTEAVVSEDTTVQELAELAKKLGERRDRNKALMGKVSSVRGEIMNRISHISNIERTDLRHYFLKDIFDLLAKNKQLPEQEIEKRKGRIVLHRQEREVYGVEAVSISESTFPQLTQNENVSEISGHIASAGIVQGKVRRVYTIEEAKKVKNDEILVAYGTDFDLMIGLQNCAGVITEEGGLLSHASVISRDLGKPCLINVKNAMSLLKDGDVIEINTNKSKVEIISRQRNTNKTANVAFLEDMCLEEITGAKAQNLRLVEQAGLPILPAIVATVETAENVDTITDGILDALREKGISTNSVIVRSNTVNEDTADQSMAGQYNSLVCRAERENIKQAISGVLTSYKKTKIQQLDSGKDPGTAVLIQPYYAQEYGGVAFSHHPITKKSGVIIEASDKGAGAVVEGGKTTSDVPVKIQKEVTEAVHKIEKALKCPVDVEWGYGADGLKIFQARPITFREAEPEERLKKLIIIAGGEGSRIKEMFNNNAAPFTKHFLPIPEKGGSILGAVIEKSDPHFDTIEISASQNTIDFARATLSSNEKVKITNDSEMIGPLGPPLLELLASGKRIYACCGDVYSNFDWKEMETLHEKSGNAVTILVSKSFPAEKAACFTIDEEAKVTGWSRKEKSTDNDYINIGGYIIDPSPEVIKIAQELIAQKKCKEDLFFEKCIDAGILSGFKDEGFSCNINTPDVYQKLVAKLVEEQNEKKAPGQHRRKPPSNAR